MFTEYTVQVYPEIKHLNKSRWVLSLFPVLVVVLGQYLLPKEWINYNVLAFIILIPILVFAYSMYKQSMNRATQCINEPLLIDSTNITFKGKTYPFKSIKFFKYKGGMMSKGCVINLGDEYLVYCLDGSLESQYSSGVHKGTGQINMSIDQEGFDAILKAIYSK